MQIWHAKKNDIWCSLRCTLIVFPANSHIDIDSRINNIICMKSPSNSIGLLIKRFARGTSWYIRTSSQRYINMISVSELCHIPPNVIKLQILSCCTSSVAGITIFGIDSTLNIEYFRCIWISLALNLYSLSFRTNKSDKMLWWKNGMKKSGQTETQKVYVFKSAPIFLLFANKQVRSDVLPLGISSKSSVDNRNYWIILYYVLPWTYILFNIFVIVLSIVELISSSALFICCI